ncbi:MAG: hypothetical protein II453_18485 [Alphaproteobacteria bacterium]|nr:hypothetical protein [Alphaproteobacteria bacterium]
MSVRITIECEDHYVSDSLCSLCSHVNGCGILEPVYNNGKEAKYVGNHCTAKIEYIKDNG